MPPVEAPPVAPAAAAPAAPAASPSPAPAAPAAASPAAPAVESAKPAPEPGSPEFFAQALEKAVVEKPADKDEAAKPAESEAKPAEAAPAVEETPEQKAAREAAAAETPEQKKEREAAEAEAAKKAAEPPPNQQEIDLGESIAPAALLESIDKAPDAVKEWFNDPANPLKETLTTMARRAAIADPILREIPDIETAQQLVKTGAEYEAFDNSFNQINDVKSAIGWWESMYNSQATKGEDGKVTPHPAFAQLERAIVESNVQWMLHNAKTSGNWHPRLSDMLYDALDLKLDTAKKAIAAGQNVEENEDAATAIEAFLQSSPRPSNKPPEMTPEQKAKQRELDAREKTQNEATAAERKAAIGTALATVTKDVDSSIADQFVPMLDKAGLTDFEFEQAVVSIGNALEEELGKHQYYNQRKAQLTAAIERDPSQVNIAALKKHELTYRNMKIGRITKEVLRKATEGAMKRQGERQEKIKQQVDTSKAEPRGTSAAPAPAPVKGATIADSQAAWEADPKNAGIDMPMEFHFSRLMGGKK